MTTQKTEAVKNTYDDKTINAPGIFARCSHRKRMDNALRHISKRLDFGKVLDFGCGSGVLISRLNEMKADCAIGYEPFSKARHRENLPIYSDYADILNNAPYPTITILEVLEHIGWNDMPNVFAKLEELLTPGGLVIVSVPIEIGPAVFAKHFNRLKHGKGKQFGKGGQMGVHDNFVELISAALFGAVGYRDPLKGGHTNFDFRHLIKFARSRDWQVKILGYSPIPLIGWYGNSQVFFTMER